MVVAPLGEKIAGFERFFPSKRSVSAVERGSTTYKIRALLLLLLSMLPPPRQFVEDPQRKKGDLFRAQLPPKKGEEAALGKLEPIIFSVKDFMKIPGFSRSDKLRTSTTYVVQRH